MTPAEIRNRRTSLGLSQGQLGDLIGVTQATISNWETGRTVPSARMRDRLADAFVTEEEEEDDYEAVAEESSSPQANYGDWLVNTRIAHGLSRQQLAAAAGVSEPQIWNIETGRTINPRSTTRSRLEQALGTAAPDEIVEAVEQQAEIGSVGQLTDFDPHVEDELPQEAGVYVLYDISDRPIYVGESGNIRDRIRNGHLDKFWYRRPIVENAAYVRVEDQTLRRQLEVTLIKFLKSNAVINQRSVAR